MNSSFNMSVLHREQAGEEVSLVPWPEAPCRAADPSPPTASDAFLRPHPYGRVYMNVGDILRALPALIATDDSKLRELKQTHRS